MPEAGRSLAVLQPVQSADLNKASNQLHEQESTKQRLVGHERQRNKVLVEAKQAEEKPRWRLHPEVCLHKHLARTRQHAASRPRHA